MLSLLKDFGDVSGTSASGEKPKREFRGSTIHDVVKDGVPYGDVAMRLKVDHHNFFRCKIFDRRSCNLAEIALFENTDNDSIFDSKGNIRPEAKSTNFVQIALKAVEGAFNDGGHPVVPDDIIKTPELVEDLSVLLIRTALANAQFYRQTCGEIMENHSSSRAISDKTQKVVSGTDLSSDFDGTTEATKQAAADVARKYYDHDTMGGNHYGMGIHAYHLAMTIIDPDHETPLMHQRGFQIFYNQINPERRQKNSSSEARPTQIPVLQVIPR